MDDQVMQQLDVVRQSGRTNMFDKEGVRTVAQSLELAELVAAIEEENFGSLLLKFSTWKRQQAEQE